VSQDLLLKTSFVVALVSILLFPQSARCQVKDKPSTKAVQQTRKPPEDRTHWKFFLDSLIVETRLVDPEDERPLVMADVADTYWLIDQQQAKKLFTEAFDVALAFPKNEPVAPVLSRIAKRDRALATELTKRLLAAKSEETDSAARSFRTARELLTTDPKFAVELAKLSASSLGPSMDGLSFLFKVAGTDPAAATEIYNAYINNIARTGNGDLGSILWLAGYPLGYGEAYGGANDPGMLHGFWGMRVPGLKPQPELAARYLQIAFAAITNTLKRAAEAGNAEKEPLNAIALYATSYLFPEVQRYLPDAEAAWSGLYRQALAGTTALRQAEIEQRLRSMQELRARTSEQSAEEYARTDARRSSRKSKSCPTRVVAIALMLKLLSRTATPKTLPRRDKLRILSTVSSNAIRCCSLPITMRPLRYSSAVISSEHWTGLRRSRRRSSGRYFTCELRARL
jgi:hypothetical protein